MLSAAAADATTWDRILEVLAYFGFAGWPVAVLSILWSRRQRVQDSLASMLQGLLTAYRALIDANAQRKKTEQLKASYPQRRPTDAVVQHINMSIEKYGELISVGENAAKAMEVQLAANAFRLPNGLLEALGNAKDELLKLGRLVNDGNFDAADIQASGVKAEYQKLHKMAKGWEFSSLFKFLSRGRMEKKLETIKENDTASRERYTIDEARMQAILRLLHKRFTTERNSSFAVHPPQQIVDNPDMIEGDVNVEELAELKFKVVFQDGVTEVLSFVELMVFTHQLIFVAVETNEILAKLQKGGFGPTDVRLTMTISPRDIMTPEMVSALLQKIDLSPIPLEAL